MTVGSPRHGVAIARAPRDALPAASPYADRAALRRLLRECLTAHGLPGLPARAGSSPLAALIPPGATVLLKPNWVLEHNRSGATMDCMLTAAELILALLEELAETEASSVTIGDAPIQGCRFGEIATAGFARAARAALRSEQGLSIVDFRRTIMRGAELVAGVETEVRPAERYLLFDLGARSLLEPVTDESAPFRVTMYDPDALARTHRPGVHQYLISKEPLEHDVVFNLPKVKTHRKAGLTAALKNLVGINGNKDYLPHHRRGGSLEGGDCYPGRSPLKRGAESLYDAANRRIGRLSGQLLRKGGGALEELQGFLSWVGVDRAPAGDLEGGWYGNDTVWRMVLDLNRVLLYGRLDGTLADEVQRQVYSLGDAIVCGQGEGPLAPQPIYVGALTFADNSLAADRVHAALLRLDETRIPLLRGALALEELPLGQLGPLSVRYRDRELTREQVADELGVDALPPRGWVGHCEDVRARGGT